MIRFHALGTNFSIPALTLITPVLALRLGLRAEVQAVMLALGIHEMAHLLCAKLLRVGIAEIRLMPFGGSAKIENPYHLSGAQLISVAIAGPMANLLCAVLLSAMVQWRWISPALFAKLLPPNLILMLFNLLPALPLDGGRILYALLRTSLGERRALRLGVILGFCLSLGLLCWGCLSWFRHGVFNLSFFIASVFIVASAKDENDALLRSEARRIQEVLSVPSEARPARLIQLDDQTPIDDALRFFRPHESVWFVLTDQGEPSALIDGRSVLMSRMKQTSAEVRLGQLPAYRLSKS